MGQNSSTQSSSESAVGTTQSAEGTAQSPEGTAQSAEGTAESAEGTAQSAEGTAKSAEGTVQSAEGTAQSPEGTAQSAEGTAQSPEGTAQSAEGTAQSPEGTAQSAEGTAQSPEGTAQSPEGTAQSAEGTAQSAEGTAQSAEATPQSTEATNQSKKDATQSDGVAARSTEAIASTVEAAAQSSAEAAATQADTETTSTGQAAKETGSNSTGTGDVGKEREAIQPQPGTSKAGGPMTPPCVKEKPRYVKADADVVNSDAMEVDESTASNIYIKDQANRREGDSDQECEITTEDDQTRGKKRKIPDERHVEPKKSNKNPFKPGKPKANDTPKADSIHLVWSRPQNFYDSYQYQIRYKSTTPLDKWKFYEEQYEESSVILKNLQSNTTFVFQVRMVNNEEEGPYSDLSDEIATQQSAANRVIEFSHVVPNASGSVLTKRKLLLEENVRARNTVAKTRKLYLGTPKRMHGKEKTILLVGATGSGKSTLVDGFINYILGVNWDDPFRFTLVDLEEEERGLSQNQAVSQTHWITTYCIYPLAGGRLDYKLNIIDTPGFGDCRGYERDQQIVDQLRQLFSATDETGVMFLDAVCFLTKAPDARLTPTQKYIFNSILCQFGQDIAENINILITFADGKAPPVLAALKEAQLPHDVYFPFNNSGLYADNAGSNMSTLSPMFWEMGCKSFASFFDHLKTMPTKSLKQTKDVLCHRYQLEITIENLSPLVGNGLNKLDELREEIRILEQHKTEIEANKNFVYTVTETKQVKKDLPKGRHVTNCLQCNITCHKDCAIPKDEDKHRCWAMDCKGNCTQCSDKCHWTQHANTPYIFEYEQVEKIKTYAEKEEKYRTATGEKMTHEKVVDRMWGELEDLEIDILDMMSTVTECNNVLKQIAMRPNPLSIKEHIDLLIEGEKLEKRPGFQRRVAVLQQFRKKANIGEDVDRFRQDLIDARSHSTFHAAKKRGKKPTKNGKNRRRVFGYFLG